MCIIFLPPFLIMPEVMACTARMESHGRGCDNRAAVGRNPVERRLCSSKNSGIDGTASAECGAVACGVSAADHHFPASNLRRLRGATPVNEETLASTPTHGLSCLTANLIQKVSLFPPF